MAPAKATTPAISTPVTGSFDPPDGGFAWPAPAGGVDFTVGFPSAPVVVVFTVVFRSGPDVVVFTVVFPSGPVVVVTEPPGVVGTDVDGSLVPDGSLVLLGSLELEGSLVPAGSLVELGSLVPDGSLVSLGSVLSLGSALGSVDSLGGSSALHTNATAAWSQASPEDHWRPSLNPRMGTSRKYGEPTILFCGPTAFCC